MKNKRRIFPFFLFFTLGFSATLLAQQNHFIYIQSENNKPFYVKQDKKLFSSAASGYLIIPKLTDGEYNFTIGFPKNEWPEQSITCRVNKKDIGYSLKNFGAKGWGLFNLQTMEVIMAGVKTAAAEIKKENTDDLFNNMLSNVVNDPSIKEKKEEPKPIIEEPKAPEVVKPVNKAEVKPMQSISRILNTSGNDGTEMIYVDRSNGKEDTIRLFIPADKKTVVKEPEPVKEEIKKEEPKQEVKEQPKQPVKEEPVKDKKFIDMEVPNPNTAPVKEEEKKQPVTTDKTKEEMPVTAMPNSDCKKFATDDDFLKLRKKMAAADNDDDMIVAAKKIFKTRCFTTDQVKNLSVLFLKDKGRYDFFDAAYPFVSDTHNFPSLESQLTDAYYINRFKVMIKH